MPRVPQNPKAPPMSDYTAQALDDGSLITPNPQTPLHQYYAEIVAELSQETGIEASFYLVPTVGETEKERHLSRLSTAMDFKGAPADASIRIPESAEYFFTRDEIKAVLTHEFEHLQQGEMFTKAGRIIDTFIYLMDEVSEHRKNDFAALSVLEAEKDRNRSLTDAEKEDYKAKKFESIELYSKIFIEQMVESELKADDAVIKSGRESDLISALQKINLIALTLDEHKSGKSPEKSQWVVDVPPNDSAQWMENRNQRIASSRISTEEATHPEFSAKAARNLLGIIMQPHFHYSFVDRIKKLEEADKNRDDKSRGR